LGFLRFYIQIVFDLHVGSATLVPKKIVFAPYLISLRVRLIATASIASDALLGHGTSLIALALAAMDNPGLGSCLVAAASMATDVVVGLGTALIALASKSWRPCWTRGHRGCR